jgi:predicted transcriptional regulator
LLKTNLSAHETLGSKDKQMINQNEQIENVTFQALAHPTRRTIIRIVQSRNQGISYTELFTELGMSTGKLNYHIEQLKGLIEKNSNLHYVLTPFGKKAVEHLDLIEQKISSEDEKYVKIATLSKKTSLQPIVRAFLSIGVVAVAFLIFFWGYIGYIAITGGAPAIIYVILPVLLALGLCVLGVLIYALVKTPRWIKRLEQKYFGEAIYQADIIFFLGFNKILISKF